MGEQKKFYIELDWLGYVLMRVKQKTEQIGFPRPSLDSLSECEQAEQEWLAEVAKLQLEVESRSARSIDGAMCERALWDFLRSISRLKNPPDYLQLYMLRWFQFVNGQVTLELASSFFVLPAKPQFNGTSGCQNSKREVSENEP